MFPNHKEFLPCTKCQGVSQNIYQAHEGLSPQQRAGLTAQELEELHHTTDCFEKLQCLPIAEMRQKASASKQ